MSEQLHPRSKAVHNRIAASRWLQRGLFLNSLCSGVLFIHGTNYDTDKLSAAGQAGELSFIGSAVIAGTDTRLLRRRIGKETGLTQTELKMRSIATRTQNPERHLHIRQLGVAATLEAGVSGALATSYAISPILAGAVYGIASIHLVQREQSLSNLEQHIDQVLQNRVTAVDPTLTPQD